MKVELDFTGSIAGGEPKLKVFSRHQEPKGWYSVHEGQFQVVSYIDFAPVDQLRIKFYDKIHVPDSNKDTFIKLNQVLIDDINLQHFLFDGKFFPCYDELFHKEYSPPDYYQPGSVMYHNGTFEVDFKTPIWKFLMDSYNA